MMMNDSHSHLCFSFFLLCFVQRREPSENVPSRYRTFLYKICFVYIERFPRELTEFVDGEITKKKSKKKKKKKRGEYFRPTHFRTFALSSFEFLKVVKSVRRSGHWIHLHCPGTGSAIACLFCLSLQSCGLREARRESGKGKETEGEEGVSG